MAIGSPTPSLTVLMQCSLSTAVCSNVDIFLYSYARICLRGTRVIMCMYTSLLPYSIFSVEQIPYRQLKACSTMFAVITYVVVCTRVRECTGNACARYQSAWGDIHSTSMDCTLTLYAIQCNKSFLVIQCTSRLIQACAVVLRYVGGCPSSKSWSLCYPLA